MSKTIFLLGAGASANAGFPLMAELTDGFPAWLQEQAIPNRETTAALYDAAVARVSTAAGPPNIEWVLQLLADVTALKANFPQPVVREWEPPFGIGAPELHHLSQLIRDYIRAALSADPPMPSDYLHGLLDFRDGEPVDVFTLNYDRLVENMAVRFDIPHTTGFAENWDPTLFSLDGLQLRLYKLHGSIDWFHLVKRPVLFRGSPQHPAFKGEASTDVLLYPTRGKTTFADPFATLVARFNDSLSKAEYCVALGYSFRDAHIRRIVLDRLITNRTLQLIIVGPHPEEVLSLTADEPGEPSFADVANRVSGLWQTAKYALENRLIWFRKEEIKSADQRLTEVFSHITRRQFGDAANLLLDAITLCRNYDLPYKPVPLIKYPFGSEMREHLARTVHTRLGANAQALRLGRPLDFLNLSASDVASWIMDSVQLWLVARAMSLDEQAGEGHGLIQQFVHEVVRGIALEHEQGLRMWGDAQPWQNPTDDMKKRLGIIDACLHAWEGHAAITEIVDAADKETVRAFAALWRGLRSVRVLQQHLLEAGYEPRRTGHNIALVASHQEQGRLVALSRGFVASGLSDYWLGEPTPIV